MVGLIVIWKGRVQSANVQTASVGESYLKVMHYNIALLPKQVTHYVT